MPVAAEKKGKLFIAVSAVLFAAVFMLSLMTGRYPLTAGEIFGVIYGKICLFLHELFKTENGFEQTWTMQAELVVFNIRMPRVLAGALVGAGLSAAGTAYQGIFRNPLVSPDVLGASAGAGFGAALSILCGLGYALVSLGAFAAGILAVGAAYLVSARARRNPVLGMVLAGIMISSLLSSATSFVKLIADSNNTLPAITFWLMGSLAGVRADSLAWAAAAIAAGVIILLLSGWSLNLLTMGDDEAKSMGVNTRLMRLIIIVSATLITAACVAISGLIGWVGLIIPHFARLLAGHDNRVVMPVSVFMGASFLMITDNISRAAASSEIPLGILTAFVGAPFFLYLIIDRGNRI